ncbi:MAG: TadE family protein [Acidimicrobiales bacterium]
MSTHERGAAMVEAVIVLPVLLFLIFAIIEVGGTLRSYSGTASAVRNGGRTASLAAADSMADAQILTKVARHADSMGRDEVQFVVIWHATGPGDPVPAACLPASYTAPNSASVGDAGTGPNAMGACSVYLAPSMPGGAFAMADGNAVEPAAYYFGCAGPSDPDAWHKLDCNWPPTSRQVLTSPRGAANPHSTDFVGLYVQARHDSYTGVLGSGFTITDQSITLIEPQGYELS